MKLSDLELFLVEMPGTRADVTIRSLLVRLATDSGLEGWGETAPLWRTSELAPRRDVLLNALAGRSIFDIEELGSLDALQPAALRAGIEMACWDLMGRALDVPICRLLGGEYRQHIPVAVRLPPLESHQAAALARELATRGFQRQIITGAGLDAVDLRAVSAVRDAVGPRVELKFDARNRYDLPTASERLDELRGNGLACVIDPLADQSPQRLAVLERQTNVPLAACSSIRAASDVLAIATLGLPLSVVVNLEQVGGLLAARKCAAVAEAGHVQISLGGAGRLGIARAALVQLAAATPSFTSGHECACYQPLDDLLVEPPTLVDGLLNVPTGPGLGVDVDRAKIEKYLVA